MPTASPKIAVLGAGSFVFSLGLLYDLIVECRMAGSEIALMDVNAEMLDVMARIARRMADDARVDITITATTDREEALAGANFVTTSMAVELRKRWAMDKAVMHRHGIHEIYSECGGLGGLSYSLRSVALVLGVARDMQKLCPNAWLFNVTNPLTKIVTAVRKHADIKAVGFCSAALGAAEGYGSAAVLLKRGVDDLNCVSSGLNHFAWLLEAKDRWTGEDLLPAVNAALAAGPTEKDHYAFGPLTMRVWQQYGWLPLAGDSHTGEYFPFDPADGREFEAHHGNEQERAERRRQLVAAADGDYPWRALFTGRSWERPGLAIHSLTSGIRRRFPALNVPNAGAITGLPAEAIVEVPAVVDAGGITPVSVGALPPPVHALCATLAQVNALIADGAATGDRALLDQAIDLDPAISMKAEAHAALTDLIAAHIDQLPAFGG